MQLLAALPLFRGGGVEGAWWGTKTRKLQEGCLKLHEKQQAWEKIFFLFASFGGAGPQNSTKMPLGLKRKQQLIIFLVILLTLRRAYAVARRAFYDWALHNGALFSDYLGARFG